MSFRSKGPRVQTEYVFAFAICVPQFAFISFLCISNCMKTKKLAFKE